MAKENLFLRDVQKLREDARRSLDKGAVTPDYPIDVETTIDLLQAALATEIVCVLRYSMNAIAVSGIHSKGIAAEFQEHAADEQRHMNMLAERIDQLGGTPNFDPQGLAARSSTEYGKAGSAIDMIRENLIAERIAIEHYRDLIGYFEGKDPTTRRMLEEILEDEEDHAADMHDLLEKHDG
jgi:bacterioferritin